MFKISPYFIIKYIPARLARRGRAFLKLIGMTTMPGSLLWYSSSESWYAYSDGWEVTLVNNNPDTDTKLQAGLRLVLKLTG